MKRLFYLALLSIVLLLGTSACETPGGNSGGTPTPTNMPTAAVSPTSTPTLQPTTSPGVNQELERITTQFYNLIEAKNYSQAYTYLDPHATDPNGQVFTRQSFEQQARERDSEAGPVVSFSVSAFAPMVVATVTRTLLGPYHAHLQMKQEGATWKIISLDRI